MATLIPTASGKLWACDKNLAFDRRRLQQLQPDVVINLTPFPTKGLGFSIV